MTDLPLLPTGVNFYGVFITPSGPYAYSNYPYEHFNFATDWKPQIDAAKAIGANTVVFFGDVNWFSDGSGLTLATYLAERRVIQDYILSVGMFFICYEASSWVYWNTNLTPPTADTSGPSAPTWSQATSVIVAAAKQAASYPNCIGIVCLDEPYFNVESTFSNGTGALITNLTNVYNAVKAVVPSNMPVNAAPNACGNSAAPVWSYTGTQKTNGDNSAPISDFWIFHPFYNNGSYSTNVFTTLAQSAALRTAYPNKQIAMPSSFAVPDGDASLPTVITSITQQVSLDNFIMCGFFIAEDFPIPSPTNTLGCFTSGYANKTGKTTPFASSFVAPTVQRPVRKWAGNSRLNQYGNAGYAA